MAVVICPGGGYAGLAILHEGEQFAKWLNGQGITAFVLKYRMPNKHKEVPLDDAQQAIRYVRKHASELDIDVNKVGIAGFSAGGHLAATASTHYTTEGGHVWGMNIDFKYHSQMLELLGMWLKSTDIK